MDSKHIAQYTYFLRLVNKSQRNLVNPHLPEFTLNWVGTNCTLPPEMQTLLVPLDTYVPAIRGICRYLPMYYLVILLNDLPDSVTNWKDVICNEINSRASKLNWINGYCAGLCYQDGDHCQHSLEVSPDLFDTHITAGITFFDGIFPPQMNYNIPKLNYKETKIFRKYLIEDMTLGIDLQYVCLEMKRVNLYEPLKKMNTSTIYTTLFFPEMQGIDIKVAKSPLDLCKMIKPDEKIECAMIFTTAREIHVEVYGLLIHLSNIQAVDIPLVGALGIRRIMRPQTEDYNNVYIGFTRKKGSLRQFFAASIVLHEGDNMEQQLTIFKKKLVRHSEELCLSFVDCMKENKKEEWIMLTQQMNCLILQCDVDGTIGSNIPFASDDESPLKRRKVDIQIQNLSTVLLYIGWGNIK